MKKPALVISTAAACIALSVCLGACASGADTAAETSTPETVTETAQTRMFTDSAGREVEIPVEVTKIAGTGSMAQQVLLTIAPDKMVGLTNELSDGEAKYIGEQYRSLPVLGQLYGGKGSLNKEALAAANPQLIVDIGEYKDSIVEDLDDLQAQLGIPVIFVEATLEDFASTYTTLGDVLGEQEKGDELSAYCAGVYSDITTQIESVPASERVKIVYCMGDTGTSTLARGTYHATTIDMLCDNVAVIEDASNGGSGSEVSMEQLALWDPEMIIFDPYSIYDEVADDPTWQSLQAISSGNYAEAPGLPYNWISMPPSINRYLGLQWLAETCYPDVFTEDMYTTTSQYFKLFYNYDLTQSDYDELMADALLAKNIADVKAA